MKLERMHEQARAALNYRVQRGTMTIKLLSAMSGVGQSHVSNFLHGKRKLSLHTLSRVLVALGLEAELVPDSHGQSGPTTPPPTPKF
jgi:transcriptional regulator with XRE-family HTH domain